MIAPEHIIFDTAVRSVTEPAAPPPSALAPAPARTLSDVAFASEAQAILAALDSHHGNRSATARSLGISERTLRYRLASMRASGMVAGARA